MPINSYEAKDENNCCEHCATEFEVLQTISESELKECPECGNPVRKLITSKVSIKFNGTGFHVTDYK